MKVIFLEFYDGTKATIDGGSGTDLIDIVTQEAILLWI